MRLLIMGPPGSGKGTQAVHISHQFQVPAISTGDIFRNNVAGATPLGRVAREYMDAGEYVPDRVTNAMVRDRLAQADCESGFLLDGYPRTLQQVDELDNILAQAGTTLQAVVELVVAPDVVMNRLLLRARSGGRADDTVDVIGRRHELYIEQTAPLTACYSERGCCTRLTATARSRRSHNESPKYSAKLWQRSPDLPYLPASKDIDMTNTSPGDPRESPSACPKCESEYTYPMGPLLVCPVCGYEWSPSEAADAAAALTIRDAVGNVLADGDTVSVIKDLRIKSSSAVVKVGTRVKNIRLIDGAGEHDIDCKIDGIGPMQLKSSVVKKL